MSLEQTDPALGLDSLDLSLTGSINETVVVESSELAPSKISVDGSGSFELDRSDGSFVEGASTATYFGALLAASDGVTDFAGPSSSSLEESATSTSSRSLPDTAFLVGIGKAQLSVVSGSQIVVQGPGNFSAHFKSNATAIVDSTAVTNSSGSAGSASGVSTTALLTGASASVVPPISGATSITQQRIVSDATTGWTRNLAFNGFDPSLGALVGVEVTVSADSTGTIVAENLGPVGSALDVMQTASVSALRPNGSAFSTDTVTRHLYQTLTAFDGTEDYGGTSGVSASTTPISTLRPQFIVDYTSAQDLAPFLGTGTVTVPVVSQGTTLLTAADNLDVTAALKAGATLNVTYDYMAGVASVLSFPATGATLTIPPPQPTTSLLGGSSQTATGIQGFAAGDTIDLAGVVFDASTHATLGSNNALTVSSDKGDAALWLQQRDFTANQLHLAPDAAGTGTDVTLEPCGLAVLGGGQDAQSDYAGPATGLQHEYAPITAQNVIAVASSDNWFLAGGSGTNALQAHGGRNVLDGVGGSNFLLGGSGTDTFFVTAAVTGATWSTVDNAHAGDDVTIWGLQPGSTITWQDGAGAADYTGLTLTSTGGAGITRATLSGYTSADLADGRLITSFGSVSGQAYFHIAIGG